MDVVLVRDLSTLKLGTLGRWHVNGDRLCDAIEDPLRPGQPKVPGETAIAAGCYVLRPFVGAKLGRVARLWREIRPGKFTDPYQFECVCVHKGNDKSAVEGCIALGYSGTPGWVGDSRAAFARWMGVVEPAWARHERVGLTIIDPVPGRIESP